MKNNQDKIEQLFALLSGSLVGKQKKALLDELQKDTELSDMLDILRKMYELTPQNSKSTILAAKKLSKTLYNDFLKEQSSPEKQFGVQVFDSSLLPIPKGVRPASVDTRLLKYQFGKSIVELTVYPITVDSVEIIGQISGVEKEKKIVVIAETNGKTQKTDVDEFCLFRFARIVSGDCRLLFSFENAKEGVIELTL